MIDTVLANMLLLAVLVSANSEGVDCSPECQLEQVTVYFQALDKVFREGSTAADIDALLSHMHERVRYVHVEYGADFDRESWRAAFLRNVERGAFNNGPERKIGILKVIHGKNHAAVEYAHGAVLPDGTWESGEPLLVLFEFTEGKISRIEELW